MSEVLYMNSCDSDLRPGEVTIFQHFQGQREEEN